MIVCGSSFLFLFFCIGFISGAKLTLYPTSNNYSQWVGSGYSEVDELYADGDTTKEYNSLPDTIDLFGFSNRPTTGDAGAINSVTVYYRGGSSSTGFYSSAGVRTHDTTYWDSDGDYIAGAYADKNHTWNTNPYTSSAWTWDEIDDLVAGYRTNSLIWFSDTAKVTQCWVDVDYDLPDGEILRPVSDYDVNLGVLGKTNHFEALNESVLNRTDNIYLYDSIVTTKDIFEFNDSSVEGNYDINSITLVSHAFGQVFNAYSWGYQNLTINISGIEYAPYQQYIRTVNYTSQTWDENPATSSAWTWNDVDNIKAGVYLKCVSDTSFWVTYSEQMYLIVNYTEAEEMPSCECPASGDFEITEDCILDENCDITVNDFRVLGGNFFLKGDAELTCNTFSLNNGQGFYMEKGTKVVIHGN